MVIFTFSAFRQRKYYDRISKRLDSLVFYYNLNTPKHKKSSWITKYHIWIIRKHQNINIFWLFLQQKNSTKVFCVDVCLSVRGICEISKTALTILMKFGRKILKNIWLSLAIVACLGKIVKSRFWVLHNCKIFIGSKICCSGNSQCHMFSCWQNWFLKINNWRARKYATARCAPYFIVYLSQSQITTTNSG